MRHYPYEYTLWYNLAQAMKCEIYLKLWSYAQNCLICTLHPFYCEKKLSIRYGAHKPVRVSCSHCHVVDVMNDIILCSYTGFVLNVCLLNRCGKCTYMAINTFWIWIWRVLKSSGPHEFVEILEVLGVEELMRAQLICSIVGHIWHAVWLILLLIVSDLSTFVCSVKHQVSKG